MCYKIIKELETHDYRREGESNGARSKKNKFDNICEEIQNEHY